MARLTMVKMEYNYLYHINMYCKLGIAFVGRSCWWLWVWRRSLQVRKAPPGADSWADTEEATINDLTEDWATVATVTEDTEDTEDTEVDTEVDTEDTEVDTEDTDCMVDTGDKVHTDTVVLTAPLTATLMSTAFTAVTDTDSLVTIAATRRQNKISKHRRLLLRLSLNNQMVHVVVVLAVRNTFFLHKNAIEFF